MKIKATKKIKKISIIIAVVAVVVAIATTSIIVFSNTNPLKKASKNLTQYNIEATLNSQESLYATQTIDYINNTGESLDNICLHLYARAFRQDAQIKPYTTLNKASCYPNGESFGDIAISKVNINGNSANFEFSGSDFDILKINLSNSLQNKERINIYLEYTITIPNCTHRLGYYNNTINLGNWYPIVCYYNQGWDTNPYYSTGDPFVSECANYKVKITHPQNYLCFATGEILQQDQTTSLFTAQAVRDFAMVLASDSNSSTLQSNKTNVTYVGYSQDADIQHNAQLCKDAVEYFSDTFAMYPYKNLTVVKSAFVHGGMEYPNLVIVSDAITEPEEFAKVIVHEIAHQWWYGLVGNNQITEAWLDESLAEYSTCLFFEDNSQYGINYAEQIKDATASYLIYVDVISSLNGKVNTSMNSAVNSYTSEYEYTYMIYVKGVIMFDSLREAIGKDKLIKSLQKYCKQYMFKIATSSDLIQMFKKYGHSDLDNFFAGWLNGDNVIGQIS